MEALWSILQAQLVELSLLALASLVTAYAVPWLRQAKMAAVADRVEQLLKNAANAGMNATPGVVPGSIIPVEKQSDVINAAYRYALDQAPELTKAIGQDFVAKIKARLVLP